MYTFLYEKWEKQMLIMMQPGAAKMFDGLTVHVRPAMQMSHKLEIIAKELYFSILRLKSCSQIY